MLTAQPEDAPKSKDDLRKAVIFYASFDEAVQADIAGGQATLDTRFGPPGEPERYTFEKGFNEKVFRIAKDNGIRGGALEVVDVLPNNGRVFFPAKGNLPFDPKGWEGALSVWCKTDPNELLKTTFCDPIQITEKGANNGGLWFDFNNTKPRDMRHGAFPAVPAGQKPIAEEDPQAPLVQVGKVDWKADDWHHVVLTWSGFDTGKNDAVSKIFIDGKLIGEIRDHPLAMQWDLEKNRHLCGRQLHRAARRAHHLPPFALRRRSHAAVSRTRVMEMTSPIPGDHLSPPPPHFRRDGSPGCWGYLGPKPHLPAIYFSEFPKRFIFDTFELDT